LSSIRQWLSAKAVTLGLLPSYCRELKNHWAAAVFGAGIPALTLMIWSLFASPPYLLVLSIFFGAFIVAGYYAWRSVYLDLIPKLELTFENGNPFLVPTRTNDGEDRIYVRILPKCLSAAVENCRGYLLDVCKYKDGRWEPTALNEGLDLLWSNHDTAARRLIRGVNQTLDVFFVGDRRKIIIPTVDPLPNRVLRVFDEPGIFRFNVMVTGDHAPNAVISLKVPMNSDWRKPSVEIIR
jgi:hypothetical protein